MGLVKSFPNSLDKLRKSEIKIAISYLIFIDEIPFYIKRFSSELLGYYFAVGNDDVVKKNVV